MKTRVLSKNLQVERDALGVYRVTNPISGELLIIKDINQRFKDPLTGAHLQIIDGKVFVTTPGQFNQLVRSRRFMIGSEADVSVQTQRKTIHFNRCVKSLLS